MKMSFISAGPLTRPIFSAQFATIKISDLYFLSRCCVRWVEFLSSFNKREELENLSWNPIWPVWPGTSKRLFNILVDKKCWNKNISVWFLFVKLSASKQKLHFYACGLILQDRNFIWGICLKSEVLENKWINSTTLKIKNLTVFCWTSIQNRGPEEIEFLIFFFYQK